MSSHTPTLNRVFADNYDMLVAWARCRVQRHIGDPEEFVHLAYLRCRRTWRADRYSARQPVSYLVQALRWVILDALRHHTRRLAREADARHGRRPASHPSPSGQVIADEALAALEGRPRQVCLAILSGKSATTIRRELRISRGAMAVHLCRARATLRRALE